MPSDYPQYNVVWANVAKASLALILAGLAIGTFCRPAFIVATCILALWVGKIRIAKFTIHKDRIDPDDQQHQKRSVWIMGTAFIGAVAGSAHWLRSPTILNGDLTMWAKEIVSFTVGGLW